MLLRTAVMAFVGGTLLMGAPAEAQSRQPVSIAAYYRCDPGREARADTIIRDLGEIISRQVAAGHVTAWGWLSHQLGGTWRRALYYIGSNRDALLEARTRILQEVSAEKGAASREFNQICGVHEDYLWRPVSASTALLDVGRMRASASLSMYYTCEPARLARADALLGSVFGPYASKSIRDGALNNWSWNAHELGGEFNRLLLMDGMDAKSLLNARDAIMTSIEGEREAALREFEAICPRHQDYIWSIVIAEPGTAPR